MIFYYIIEMIVSIMFKYILMFAFFVIITNFIVCIFNSLVVNNIGQNIVKPAKPTKPINIKI